MNSIQRNSFEFDEYETLQSCILCHEYSAVFSNMCYDCDNYVNSIISNSIMPNLSSLTPNIVADFIMTNNIRSDLINCKKIRTLIDTESIGNVILHAFRDYTCIVKEERVNKTKYNVPTYTSQIRCQYGNCRHSAIIPIPDIFDIGTRPFDGQSFRIKIRHQTSKCLCMKHFKLLITETLNKKRTSAYVSIIARLIQLYLIDKHHRDSEYRIYHKNALFVPFQLFEDIVSKHDWWNNIPPPKRSRSRKHTRLPSIRTERIYLRINVATQSLKEKYGEPS
jgi:hypothetical protein